MNVYDQAHGLAQAIKASEEFKQYDAVKKQVDANEELSKMIKDFQAKQLELQTKQMMGETPGSEDMAVIKQLYAIFLDNGYLAICLFFGIIYGVGLKRVEKTQNYK